MALSSPEAARAGEGLHVWIVAARPRTLPAALSPVVVGIALAAADRAFALFPALAALAGTYYAQALNLTPLVIIAALPVGALTVAILVVNNLRDMPFCPGPVPIPRAFAAVCLIADHDVHLQL